MAAAAATAALAHLDPNNRWRRAAIIVSPPLMLMQLASGAVSPRPTFPAAVGPGGGAGRNCV